MIVNFGRKSFLNKTKKAKGRGREDAKSISSSNLIFFYRTVRKSAQNRLQVELARSRPFMSFEIVNDFRIYIICAC